MKKLTLTLEEEINILNKYKLTPNELMFIRTLLILQDEHNEELFKNYIKVLYNCQIKIRDVIKILQDKEIINKSYKLRPEGSEFDPFEIPFNKVFIKTLYKCSFELGKELFDVYPQFSTINGNLIPLRTVAKKFDSLEDCYYRYGKEIKWNQNIHNNIIELVKWGNDNDIINCSLASFIINNGWNDLQALKDGGLNINLDSVKMI